MKNGDKIIFTGCDDVQHRWGNHTGNYHNLVIGNEYTIKNFEIHTWHTKIFLEEEIGSFNSVCFDGIDYE